MNTWQLAEDFRASFEGDAAFAANHFYTGQDIDTFETPALVFSAVDEPFSVDGKAGRFNLTVYVHGSSTASDAIPNPDEAQAATVAAVCEKLFGTGKTALLTALNALTRWDIRGWSAGAQDPSVVGMRFETPIIATGTAIQI